MSAPTPCISVVMAAHNAEAYVEAAVNSILRQTFGDFELIIIDDGSRDGTWTILERLAQQDARIRLERNPSNKGVSHTRNRGTEMAQGELIAVMDSDDISLPDRLQKQVAYMDNHPEIGALGGAIRQLQGRPETLSEVFSYPLSPAQNAWHLHFGPPIMHPVSMLRRALLVEAGGYRPEYVVAHDYELWTRMSRLAQFANLPDVLLHYRRHTDNITLRRRADNDREAASISRGLVEARLGRTMSIEAVARLPRFHIPEPRTVTAISACIYELACCFGESTQLAPDEWRTVKQDAAYRILRMLAQVPPNLDDGRSLLYAMRLDPAYTARWLRSKLRKSVQYQLARLAKTH